LYEFLLLQTRPQRQAVRVRAEAPAGGSTASAAAPAVVTKSSKRIADNITELIGGEHSSFVAIPALRLECSKASL
jgi:hypothetical protein